VLLVLAVGVRVTGTLEGAHTVEERVLAYLAEAEVAAAAADVDLALLLAVCATESAGRADAVSARGARGLMQLMPATAAELAGGERPDLHDAGTSLRLGALYLREQLDRFAAAPCAGELALAAYNAGPGRVRGWLADAPLEPERERLGDWVRFPETRGFIARVTRWRARFDQLLAAPTRRG